MTKHILVTYLLVRISAHTDGRAAVVQHARATQDGAEDSGSGGRSWCSTGWNASAVQSAAGMRKAPLTVQVDATPCETRTMVKRRLTSAKRCELRSCANQLANPWPVA